MLGITNYQFVEAIHGNNLLNDEYRKKVSKRLDVYYHLLSPDFWRSRRNWKTMSNKIQTILPQVGCYLSHLHALQLALEAGHKEVIIMEDDAIIKKDIDFTVFNPPADYDLFYLGGTFWHLSSYREEGSIIKVEPEHLKLCGTYCYLTNNIREKVDVLRSVFKSGNAKDKVPDFRNGETRLRASPIDLFYINHYQKHGNCYFINPQLVVHPEIHDSDIENNKLQRNYNLSFTY
jgi:GR25 family glycosyltransferase involved in LPS biosynthesis